VARFPNDLATTEDDEKFNHESCIRLITRLIFVWFLKQKHLIPEEFFDENYIREHLIENFDPHDRQSLYYNAEESKYYRLILQNLFFAMLNRPIVPEGKDTPNNRRFRVKGNYHGMNPDYAVNNLLRYEGDFKDGGAAEFLAMANSNVPFLNGGLFDCLDDKPKNLYYDGFSERRESLEQLYLPDWLFFGEEVGKGIDLSQWYDDAKKRNVSARGIIDILKRYNFTIEENTPLDQEVSLDPELLGKAFENLLASYNPETKTSARKQTGSFYTPREIVQYMVDESLVAHLKRICGDELEPQYRSLLSYATEETALNEEQRRSIMQAIYNCRVLDPACGSGAFPMGVLQQMVHILRQLDPTNEMWKDFMIDIAIDQSRKAFNAEEEEERKARLADIEEAFNRDVNDPDYARKLYLIEHCIYGVDIQPIAVQISKLRFFISLVVDQNPTDDAAHNFGIRPLPNLESKFVAANTLIPVEYDASLFESTEAILSLKESLKELNHAIFLAKRNIDKQRIKTKIKDTRKALANAIEDTGFVNPGAAQKLADWDMFEQNTHADFFDAEWMFGVKGGFDIVIANPPYVNVKRGIDEHQKLIYKETYKAAKGQYDLFTLFIEYSITVGNVISLIVPKPLLNNENYKTSREQILKGTLLQVITGSNIFDDAGVESCIFVASRQTTNDTTVKISKYDNGTFVFVSSVNPNTFRLSESSVISTELDMHDVQVMKKFNGLITFDSKFEIKRGVEAGKKDDSIVDYRTPYQLLRGQDVEAYSIHYNDKYIEFDNYDTQKFKEWGLYSEPKILIRRVSNQIIATYDKDGYVVLNTIYCVKSKTRKKENLLYYTGLFNSKAVSFWFTKTFCNTDKLFPYIRTSQLKQLPLPAATEKVQSHIESIVEDILEANKNGTSTAEYEQEIDRIVYHLYGLTYDEVLIIEPTPPFTQEEYEQDNL